jgi:hypothetical protein
MMAKNKLYTKSYLTKRLIESKLNVAKLIDKYSDNDIRQWTIIIDPGIKANRANILLTCFKESPDNFWFVANSQRGIGSKIKTLSVDVLVEILMDIIKGPEKVIPSSINNSE